LAGVPQPVIRAARKHLAWLEQQSADATPTPQMDLFAAPATPLDDEMEVPAPMQTQVMGESSAALDALEEIDPDNLSPRDALEALYRLKTLAQSATRP